jgi:hypothetical protein
VSSSWITCSNMSKRGFSLSRSQLRVR